jgi:hypothetical protein
LGENKGKFEDFNIVLENRERVGIRRKVAPKKRKISDEKNSYKVDKLLRSSWKVDKHRLGEWLDHGPAKIKSRRKWTSGQAPTWRMVGSWTNQD